VLADRIVSLLEDHIDLAVRIGPLSDGGLVATRVGEIRSVVCASPAYFAARGVPQRPADLGVHDCITFERSPDVWRFPAGKSDAPKSAASKSAESKSAGSVPIRARLVVNSAEAAIDAAVGGLGITRVLSYQVVSAIRAGSLAVVLQDFEPAPWPVSLVYPGSGRLLPLKLRAFLDFAAPRLKAVTFAA
jgi:DNA-binding transcriptional LysR family regulator